jgi:hypothetical protein
MPNNAIEISDLLAALGGELVDFILPDGTVLPQEDIDKINEQARRTDGRSRLEANLIEEK